MRDPQTIKADIRALRAEMRTNGIKKTSSFNGGMDMDTYRANARRLALETELQITEKAEPPEWA